MRATAYVAGLELDLEVFSGPFDLLLTLILKEEVDLLEVDLADVVLTYLDHLEARGDLDLEVATEFLVLIASLLELKSRLLLREEEDELGDLQPEEAAEELMERMLQARRYRHAAEHLAERLGREDGKRFRTAPPPPHLRRFTEADAVAVHNPARLGRAIGQLLRMPPRVDLHHVTIARVSLPERLAHLRSLLRRGTFTFSDAVRGADRTTVAVTLWALLELYKQGEADWTQDAPFAEIHVAGLEAGQARWSAADRERRPAGAPA
ncbi:ScpA family protein [Patulibacter sp. SYSU D01012]|uniref:segregation and condensation protein A n=1 Tax=Patulibacter sp. SYSU D01012 TaxID=2817381 RepID=UPI001B306E80